MKYDLLFAYRKYLESKYSKDTAKMYFNRLDSLMNGQNLLFDTEKIDIEKILSNIAQIKYKNHFSQSKNAFLHFCEFQNISLSKEQLEQIESLQDGTRKKYRHLIARDYNAIETAISKIKNEKLKLSYQTLLATGLRVSELSQIKSLDCSVSSKEIILSFIAKGGNKENVIIIHEERSRLYNDLRNIIDKTEQTRRVFCSANYLQTKAKELDFTCHDLRRAYAKLEYKETKSKAEVMKKLRHKNLRTTNIYLRSKIKV